MKLPWNKPKRTPTALADRPPSFAEDITDVFVLRRHAIRALAGTLMERHSACRSPHPFCGRTGHQKDGDTEQLLIAEAIPQKSPEAAKPDIIGIYLIHATVDRAPDGPKYNVPEYMARMRPAKPVPSYKLAVGPPTDGLYPVTFGPILNPVEGDYSTGSVDRANARLFNVDPKPKHCRWEYWPTGVKSAEKVAPRFNCLQVLGEWGIVEPDTGQLVAAVEYADNPSHNFGLHDKDGDIFKYRSRGIHYIAAPADSELSKVLRDHGL